MKKRASLAKISRPRLHSVMPRERLFSLLDDNRGQPLTWVHGPPGAGKTALVASYVESRELSALWYQVDAGDADPASVFYYLISAAESLLKAEAIPLPRFAPEHLADLTAFARIFFRAYFAVLPPGTVWVLDNYQEALPHAPFHKIILEAIAELPAGLSLIAISRAEAPPSFARLIANGAMVGLGWEKLQLTLDEVRGIAEQRKIIEDWLVRALHQQSQGWAAGITLMLERLGHVDGSARELPNESRESVFDYFASLIFDQAPESTRHILLSIAFLPRVTPSLAVELSGRVDAPVWLEDLYLRRMFTDRRPGAEPVYQFHALFLGFLRTRAEEVFNPEDFSKQLRRSAAALEHTGEIDAAMELWLQAHDWDHATGLTLREENALLNGGRRETLVRWLHALPEHRRSNDAWLLYWLGRAQVQTVPAEGIKTLEFALRVFRRSNDTPGCIECLAALIVASFIGFGALDTMDRWLDELLAELQPSPSFASVNVELKILGVLCMALFHVRPWHPLTISSYQRVEELLPHCSDTSIALAAAMGALVVSGLCGDLERGDRIACATESLALRDAASPTEAMWWFAQVGYLRLVQARYDDALSSLDKGIHIAQSHGLQVVLPEIMLWRYTVEFRAFGWAAADPTLEAVQAMSGSRSSTARAMLFFFEARRESNRGNADQAARLTLLGAQVAMHLGSRYEELVFSVCCADIMIEAGEIEEAKQLNLRSRTLIERATCYGCWRAVQLLLEAWLASKENDAKRTLMYLRQSLAVAREGNQRYYLRFADRALAPLFRLAIEEGIEVSLVQDLIRTFRLKPPKDAADRWPWPVRIVTLGRFEIQVGGEPIEFSRKLPRKTLLLLKAILAHGGREVPEQTLCDALWGDEEGDAARNALAITVLRLRKLLGSNECVIYQGGNLSLNSEICWVDSWVFAAHYTDAGCNSQKVLALYGGAFLPEDEGEPWSVAPRERLRGKFIDALSRYGTTLEAEGDLLGAVQCYMRGIDADSIVESFHQGLMRCYERLDKRTEALSVYRRLKHTLSVVLGVPPSDATQRLFQDMLQRHSEPGAFPGSERKISSASKQV